MCLLGTGNGKYILSFDSVDTICEQRKNISLTLKKQCYSKLLENYYCWNTSVGVLNKHMAMFLVRYRLSREMISRTVLSPRVAISHDFHNNNTMKSITTIAGTDSKLYRLSNKRNLQTDCN